MSHNHKDVPLTIGLPVKNAEGTIRHVIGSLLQQSYSNFVLVISDNNSSDATADICAEFAKNDARIQFYSQPIDLGAYANFRFVYDQAKTEFFMWAAADDVRSENHFESTLGLLINNSNAAIAGSINTHTSGSKKFVNFSIVGDAEKRVQLFLKNANKSNGVFYGMFRRAILRDYKFPESPFLGWDWILILELLRNGDFLRSHSSTLELGSHGESRSDSRWSQWRSTPVQWVLPFLKVNSAVMQASKCSTLRHRTKVVYFLIRINLLAVLDQIQSEFVISTKRAAKYINQRFWPYSAEEIPTQSL